MQNTDQHQRQRARPSGSSTSAQPYSQTMASVQSAPPPSRQQHSEESWVEIESRASSSSLSSVTDEIITTGLRVQHDSNIHRRRRRRSASVDQFQVGTGYHVRTGGGDNSSQEEYDESESSESDRVMMSSTEGIGASPLQHELGRSSQNSHSAASSTAMSEREGDDEGDEDENATAVNYPRSTARQFQPRPNVFSHPPVEHVIRAQSGTIPVSRRPAARSSSQRHSFPQHSLYHTASPNYQPDHDEALRASLSTLLSAAAAVRGLPKPGQTRTGHSNASTRIDPTSLRLVSESVALGEIAEEASSNRDSSRASPSVSSPASSEKLWASWALLVARLGDAEKRPQAA